MKRNHEKRVPGGRLRSVLLALVFVVFVCAYWGVEHFSVRSAPEDPEESAAPEELTATFILPDGSQQSALVTADTVLSSAPETDEPGFTLVAWRDGEGTSYSPGLPAEFHGDVTLTAVLMPELETGQHIAYMPLPPEESMFAPDDALTLLQLAECAVSLLAVEVEPTEAFVSVSPLDLGDADILKTLGVMTGSSLNPLKQARVRDLACVFAAFFPGGPERGFANIPKDDPDYAAFCTAASLGWFDGGSAGTIDPDAVVTRAEAAHFINRVLGRQPAPQDEDISGVFADVPPEHPYRDDIIEAAVLHTYRMSGGAEKWTAALAVPRRETGLYRWGTLLRCIDEDGYIVKDGQWGGFEFDADGVYTCGMPELDKLVQGVLAGLDTGGMEDAEALRAVYNYTRDSFTYLRRNYYDPGEEGWGEQEAYTMLSTGMGNCYCYAATFYELSRALGFDARLISGFVASNRAPHGWVEFEIDGSRYICDTELEMTYYRDKRAVKPDMFMMPNSVSAQWSYKYS